MTGPHTLQPPYQYQDITSRSMGLISMTWYLKSEHSSVTQFIYVNIHYICKPYLLLQRAEPIFVLKENFSYIKKN